MNLETVEIPRAGAREQAAEYRRAAKRLPEGSEQRREFEAIARAYRIAARDETPLIALTPTVVAGGLTTRSRVYRRGRDEEYREHFALPRLAVCRASAAFVYTRGVQGNGGLELIDSLNRQSNYRSGVVTFARGAFELPTGYTAGWSLLGGWRSEAWAAMVPIVPPKHRPSEGLLERYLVLWEVDEWAWQVVPRPPGDPALLRHVGGDIYAVLATWNLTELERLVLTGRQVPAR
jgi:hypothetical protein